MLKYDCCLYKKIINIVLLLSLGWLFFSSATFFTEMFSLDALENTANIIELALGFISAIILFLYYYNSNKFLSFGIGCAILSWSLGELFWFSAVKLIDNGLPYPSVGDFGFLGAYFFIVGALGQIQKNRKRKTLSIIISLIILFAMFLFFFNTSNGVGVLIYNIIFISAVVISLFSILIRWDKKYKALFMGIGIFCIADIIFMIEANLRDFTFICDMIYPLSIALMAYGIMKEGDRID